MEKNRSKKVESTQRHRNSPFVAKRKTRNKIIIIICHVSSFMDCTFCCLKITIHFIKGPVIAPDEIYPVGIDTEIKITCFSVDVLYEMYCMNWFYYNSQKGIRYGPRGIK